MDELDAALLASWRRLSHTVRTDRAERARRGARRRAIDFSRPLRQWCLCIRAADTRLDSIDVLHEPEHALDSRHPHDITLTSDDLVRLTRPVNIDWPGIDWTHTAARLGRHAESIRHWFKDPRFVVEYRPPLACRKRGKKVPFIHTRGPIDPNAVAGRPHNQFCSEAWLHHHTRVPPNLRFQLRRLPDFIKDRRGHHDPRGRFRGWQFICPGLPEFPPCGRVVCRVFFPLPVVDLPTLLGEADPLSEHPLQAPPPFAPACHHCHRVRHMTQVDRSGWNGFVAHISRGLLHGRDVPRPASAPRLRVRQYKSRPRLARKLPGRGLSGPANERDLPDGAQGCRNGCSAAQPVERSISSILARRGRGRP